MKTFKEYAIGKKVEETVELTESLDNESMNSLILDFMKGVQKVVEISIAMHEEDIIKDPTKGMNKALDYVMAQYKKQSMLDNDMLTLLIKSSLFTSMKENGIDVDSMAKGLLKDVAKLRRQ